MKGNNIQENGIRICSMIILKKSGTSCNTATCLPDLSHITGYTGATGPNTPSVPDPDPTPDPDPSTDPTPETEP